VKNGIGFAVSVTKSSVHVSMLSTNPGETKDDEKYCERRGHKKYRNDTVGRAGVIALGKKC